MLRYLLRYIGWVGTTKKVSAMMAQRSKKAAREKIKFNYHYPGGPARSALAR